jgi:hypothetical protein
VKKALITFSLISLMVNPAFANDRNKTIVINLDNVSNEVVSKIKSDSDKIMSKIDLTHLVAFVRNWKDKDLRKKELVNLYSSVIPQAFQKYPNSKEFHLSAFVNTKNRDLNKNEIKNISKIVVTKDDLDKIDWKSLNISNIRDNKHIKQIDFID